MAATHTNNHRLPAVDAKTQELGEKWLSQMAVVNLDEVSPPPITVAFREYIPTEEAGPDGTPVTRYSMQVRHATIETFIPHDLFLKTLALKEMTEAMQAEGGVQEQVIVERMVELALEGWQLTEPDMTMPRFRKGLSFNQIQGIFYHFFGVPTLQNTPNP